MIIEIDHLAAICGYFEPDGYVYTCNHPDQENRDEDGGKCYSFCCPLGYELDLDDPRDRAIFVAAGFDPDEVSPGCWLKLHEPSDP